MSGFESRPKLWSVAQRRGKQIPMLSGGCEMSFWTQFKSEWDDLHRLTWLGKCIACPVLLLGLTVGAILNFLFVKR